MINNDFFNNSDVLYFDVFVTRERVFLYSYKFNLRPCLLDEKCVFFYTLGNSSPYPMHVSSVAASLISQR